MKKPLLLCETAYFILSLGNMITLLLIPELTTQAIALSSLSIGMLVIWFAIKLAFFRFNNESTLLLTLTFIIIIIRVLATFDVGQTTIEFSDIFLIVAYHGHPKFRTQIQVCSSYNLHNFHYFARFQLLQTYPIYIHAISLSPEKVLCHFIYSSNSITRNNTETPKRHLKASSTWYEHKDLENKTNLQNINKIICSQPNMHHFDTEINDDILDALSKVSNLFNFPYVITDDEAKPLVSNQLFQELTGITDNKHAQYSLVSILIKKIDKKIETLFKLKFDKSNQHAPLFRSSSVANTFQVCSISSSNFKLQLSHILRIMNTEQHLSCQVLDFESELFPPHYQIDIKHIKGHFLFVFTKVSERDDYNNKINTRILMNQLFRSLSHEFSTSLNSIQILAENALEELPKTTVDKYIRPLLNSCYILNSIIQDVRDFSLILSKNFTLSIRKTSINVLVKAVAQLFINQIEMKGLSISLQIDDITIHTDGQRVKQALINLIQNAQKFTFKGSITIVAKIEIIKEVKYIKISVSDTGPGIDADQQQKIRKFLSSKQHQRLRDKNQSFGMGLLITDKIAKGLCPTQEGGIYLESQQNKGSSFWFYIQDLSQQEIFDNNHSKQTIKYRQINSIRSNSKFDFSFPLSPSSREMKKSLSINNPFKLVSGSHNPIFHQIQSDISSENLSCYEEIEFVPSPYIMKEGCKKPQSQIIDISSQISKILIIDDEYVNIYALKIMLNRLNYSCEAANNGQEGFEKFKEGCFMIIFMDIEMPIMNGVTATRLIRQYCQQHQLQQPSIIAQTAYTDSGTKQICSEAGMDYFLQKPIHTQEIISILGNLQD